MSIGDIKTCTACYYVRREPPGVHPLMCEREMPTIRTSAARAPGGACEGGKNWLRNHRHRSDDEPLD